MNIYLISQEENGGYDTYSNAVVIAPDEETARNMDPGDGSQCCWSDHSGAWASKPENVTVKKIGTADEGAEQGLVLGSYHAG